LLYDMIDVIEEWYNSGNVSEVMKLWRIDVRIDAHILL